MQIGIAGIGKMGAAIAQRLMEVGHKVTVWNRSADKLQPLTAAGAATAATPAELARNAEAVSGVRPTAVPSLGATDCKFWRYRKVPAYIYGPAPTRMAAADECVSVDEFMTVIKTHALSAWDYLTGNE